MVYSFNWNTAPQGNKKTTEAITTQYIKAKYGTTPAEFAKMLIKKQPPQEKHLPAQITIAAVEQAAAM